MSCFVIMPFAPDFDDVYASIKIGVANALGSKGGRCFRLDEARPAGRITDRLLTELRAAAFCVADLTGNAPNVMWEVGYAMALGKPIVIITQRLADLPFDLKDMQSLQYDRHHLNGSLARPLQRVVADTLAAGSTIQSPAAAPERVISELRNQVRELKSIVSQAVDLWSPREYQSHPATDLMAKQLSDLAGVWVNNERDSHMYAAVIDGDLIVPYCFGGNHDLTGVYFGWKRIGEHWFARFSWLNREIAGFVFLRQVSNDVLSGAWWYDREGLPAPTTPPESAGSQLTLQRRPDVAAPTWAAKFLEDVRRQGLETRLSLP